jgi:hypothetical protein
VPQVRPSVPGPKTMGRSPTIAFTESSKSGFGQQKHSTGSIRSRYDTDFEGTAENGPSSHGCDALYQGTTLVGPMRSSKIWALAPGLFIRLVISGQAFRAGCALAGAKAQFSFIPLRPD